MLMKTLETVKDKIIPTPNDVLSDNEHILSVVSDSMDLVKHINKA
jgi:hypothetical protein